jgi:hypothetical protein
MNMNIPAKTAHFPPFPTSTTWRNQTLAKNAQVAARGA